MLTRQDRSFYSIGYAIALLLVVLPLLEFTLTIWPMRPGVVMWRFGSYGLLTQALMLPTVGVFLALGLARFLGHRRMQIVLGAIAALVCVALLGGAALFALDSLQARSLARADMMQQVTITLVRAFAAALVYVFIWGWMAIGALRTIPRRAASGGAGAADVLVHAGVRS
jgi:hypothetical protein